MEKTSITRILTTSDRYNCCYRCGGGVFLRVGEEDKYQACCSSCGSITDLYLVYNPYYNAEAMCRLGYNNMTLYNKFYVRSLNKLNIKNGDYILVDVDDGFIDFAGTIQGVLEFLESKKDVPDHLYKVYKLVKFEFHQVGFSDLIEAVVAELS